MKALIAALRKMIFMPVQNPQILIPYIDCLVCSMGIAMLGSTYSQYYDSINAEQFVVRTTFILIGIFNFVGKFISGSFLDQTKDAPVIFSLVGNSLHAHALHNFGNIAILAYFTILSTMGYIYL